MGKVKNQNVVIHILVRLFYDRVRIHLLERWDLQMKRGRWEILLDILNAISKDRNSKKTQTMQLARLDWRSFSNHFNYLLEQGFIEESESAQNKKSYHVTDTGEHLLERLTKVRELLRE